MRKIVDTTAIPVLEDTIGRRQVNVRRAGCFLHHLAAPMLNDAVLHYNRTEHGRRAGHGNQPMVSAIPAYSRRTAGRPGKISDVSHGNATIKCQVGEHEWVVICHRSLNPKSRAAFAVATKISPATAAGQSDGALAGKRDSPPPQKQGRR